MSDAEEIVAVDIGGTNVRFCRTTVAKGAPPVLGTIRKYKVADYPGLIAAWRSFAAEESGKLPELAAIAIAAPVTHMPVKLTNSHWVIDPDELARELGLRQVLLVNDFAAIAHGVTALPREHIRHLFGPERGLPARGTVTVLGPGTGLGVGLISMDRSGTHILATEGGHMDFAPADETDDQVLGWLRQRFAHVSVERVVSGPGLNLIHQALGALAGENVPEMEDGALWQMALSGENRRAVEALARLCMSYGSIAGDLALAHGAQCVVLAGSLTQRMRECAVFGAFYEHFLMKGRYREYMADIPVLFADHPEFGLFGAAVAGTALNHG